MKKYLLIALTGSILLGSIPANVSAQTDADGIMMGKNLFCGGIMAATSSWNQYWEGPLLRSNANLGSVKTLMIGPMGSWGVTKNLNIIFSLPYVQTRTTAGTLTGLNGFQDLTLTAKYRLYRIKKNKSAFSVFGIAGVSTPVQNYVKDLLPVSIGLGTKNFTMRAMLDYQYSDWFVTASASYIARSNIYIDRTAYYTTRMIYSNEVAMPDASYNNIRMGFRNKEIVAEAVADIWTTWGGFDITRNNMPFPSNQMNQTRIGFNAKYEPIRWKGISLTTAFYHTLEGRNMGKANFFQFGFFYIFNFSKKPVQSPTKNKLGSSVNK